MSNLLGPAVLAGVLLSLAQMPRRTTRRGYEIVMGETGIEWPSEPGAPYDLQQFYTKVIITV